MALRLLTLLTLCAAVPHGFAAPPVLKAEVFKHYIDTFNADDRELYPQFIPNTEAWEFLKGNVPLLDCPDEDIQRTYYFRWWTYRKHIARTPVGFVITEFLPSVSWAGKYNTISCAAGHHLYEGRWLRDPKYLDDYSRFWFGKGGDPQKYSCWIADGIWNRALVTGDSAVAVELLPALIANWDQWAKTHRDPNGLYWQSADRDGMELGIGGDGYRPTINSYQYGDARAIAAIARAAGNAKLGWDFACRASHPSDGLGPVAERALWNPATQFFGVVRRRPDGTAGEAVGVRELLGYTPWYFNQPLSDESAAAWAQINDAKGFLAPFGLTTVERRSPHFAISYEGHECQWNGPSWPFATSVTLTAMANLLNNNYKQHVVAKPAYLALLKTYAASHRRAISRDKVVPWIDENQNPLTGDWISRTRLSKWKNGTWDPAVGGEERGKDYNHSTFCDLVITGLVGLRPAEGDRVRVNPLLPDKTWDWFCLDAIPYHGRTLTIVYDRTGEHYGLGQGFRVLADGNEVAASPRLEKIQGELPPKSVTPAPAAATTAPAESAGGWVKYEHNPVLGGNLGTCFDVAALRDGDKYRLYFSWRPKKSIAVVESDDGIHWNEPRVVLGPDPATAWEDDVNRPAVLKRPDGYHLWYTGQAKEHSWIGHATSTDGLTWKRTAPKPVLSPKVKWEKVAVMCPDVLWDESAKEYRMYYSGGEQYEPDAIGLATSADGLSWKKRPAPVFAADPAAAWEKHKVTACHVVRRGDEYLMFYIGFRDTDHAQIGLARSKDGITGWQRHKANPILSPGLNRWDYDACYKPFAIFDGKKWLLWYNGRHGAVEQIGVAFHEGQDLGFATDGHR